MVSTGGQRFEFGGFRLDGRKRTLLDAAGRPVTITAKAFDALLYFVEHPGQVIERATLLEAVWPNTIVEENNLSQIVAALRRVLGDGFIVTVPRRGYQFVAEVRPTDDAVGPGRVDAPAGRERRTGARAARYAGTVLVAVVVLALVAVAARYLRDAPVEAAPPKVAVLPCDNLGTGGVDGSFAAGMHEEILNRLAQLSSLRVIARTSVNRYAQARPPIPQIARELDATAVVECSVRYAGENVLVTAQLIDPGTDTHLWSQAYDGDLSDVSGLFAMQADIAISIAGALNAELLPAEERELETLPTDSPAAYAEYLRSVEAGETGIAHLDRAIEIDPGFAEAYAARALLRASRAAETLLLPDTEYDFAEELRLAARDARTTLELDADNGLAHFVLGATRIPFDKPAGLAQIEHALTLSPSNSRVLYLSAGVFLGDLRVDAARALLDRIKQLDPYFFEIDTLLLLTRDLEGLVELNRRFMRVNPADARAHARLAFTEALRGNAAEARQRWRTATELADVAELANGPVIYMLGNLGLAEDAERAFAALEAQADGGHHVSDAEWMVASLGLGRIEQAYDWAAKVADRPLPPWATDEHWLVLNPLADPALETPRFLELRRRLGYGR